MRKRFYYLLAIVCCLISFSVTAQNTVGVLSLDETSASQGYNLVYPAPQSNAYLLDNCGRVVNVWTDSSNFRPGNAAYLLEDGNLFKCKRDASVAGDSIWAGGGGESVEIRDWDNNLVWSMTINNDWERMHHDAIVMPNGNVMMIVWEKKTLAESIAAGRDTSLIDEGKLWPDYLLEVTPIYPDSYTVAWEWHAWDHLVQDFDSTKDNYGDPSLESGKINLNYTGIGGGEADWLHFNALDYNPVLDQVVVSCPEFNEIWIIDHSTTTSQAASSAGGSGGRGGDLMFRWGNPMAYGKGDSTDIVFAYQHNPNWIDDLVPSSVQDYNKMIIFNNRIPGGPDGEYSAVHVLNPVFNTYDWKYEVDGNGAYLPPAADWTYVKPDTSSMYSNIISGAQRLENGNTLIDVGRPGYAFEIDENENVVWEFKNPLIASGPATQGDTLALSTNMMFRMVRYPIGFPGFAGRDLTPGGILEIGSDSTFCVALDVGTPEPIEEIQAVYPNPAFDQLTIERSTAEPMVAELYNLHGQVMRQTTIRGFKSRVDVNDLTPGIYFLRIDHGGAIKVMIGR